jgi:hypothetical protein
MDSVMVNAVLNTHLSHEDWDALRVPQAAAARRAVWAGKRVPARIILRELGWIPVDGAIWKSKLGLMEALRALPGREYASRVLEVRMRDVALGLDRRGLCGELLNFWSSIDRPQEWRTPGGVSGGSLDRKRYLAAAVAERLERDWSSWIQSCSADYGHYALRSPRHGSAAAHVAQGTKAEIGLMITARAGSCILRGNRTSARPPGDPHALCVLCDEGAREDEAHLLLSCTAYTNHRDEMWQGVKAAWSEPQIQHMLGSSQQQRALFRLGLDFPPSISPSSATSAARDLAVKSFLWKVNETRMSQGMTSLVATHDMLLEGSEEEALLWSQRAHLAEKNLSPYEAPDDEADLDLEIN